MLEACVHTSVFSMENVVGGQNLELRHVASDRIGT
jgi:hypothetical protein